jgi:phenylalanine-4-hydroxylase
VQKAGSLKPIKPTHNRTMKDSQPSFEQHLSAYEKAALDGNDPRCVPQYLDGTPPIGREIVKPEYTAEQNQNWSYLFNRQMELLPGRAGQAYLDGVNILGLNDKGIPALSDLSAALEAARGWQIARIPGLLHEKEFFELIAARTFPSTDYVREAHELDYTPAPDCFHDIFGHMPMLTEPAVADFYNMFGKSALHAKGVQRTHLERLHWFTIEFGLIRQPEGMRVFGAGIMSSKNEVVHALSQEVEVIDFSLEKVIEQDYEVWHLQPRLFALDSFDQLVDEFGFWTKRQGLAA